MENILFIVFFEELGKRETRPHNARVPLLRCETRLVNAHLSSTCAHMVYKFSPTSPTRSHDHQFLNPRQSDDFEDLKQLVLHAVLHDPVHCTQSIRNRTKTSNGHIVTH
jgi:hypothetical protein